MVYDVVLMILSVDTAIYYCFIDCSARIFAVVSNCDLTDCRLCVFRADFYSYFFKNSMVRAIASLEICKNCPIAKACTAHLPSP